MSVEQHTFPVYINATETKRRQDLNALTYDECVKLEEEWRTYATQLSYMAKVQPPKAWDAQTEYDISRTVEKLKSLAKEARMEAEFWASQAGWLM